MDRHFRRYQLVSAALFSCAHGTNDAQKTMGIITAVLVAGGLQQDFHVPSWVIACFQRSHRTGHNERRLAHCTHHGNKADPTPAAERFLRGKRVLRSRFFSRRIWDFPFPALTPSPEQLRAWALFSGLALCAGTLPAAL